MKHAISVIFPLTLCLASQIAYSEFTPDYQHHILAVDEDGNALVPIVQRTLAKDGTYRYRASHKMLDGEEIRGAKVNSALLKAAATGEKPKEQPYNDRMATVLQGRQTLYKYLDAMFAEIHRRRPKEIVIYIHGGLNNIDGAIAKSALLTDMFDEQHTSQYFIGICWNSNLMPTYGQHLFGVREGLHQGPKAVATSPTMLIADVGGAAARLPMNLASFIWQDAYAVNPRGFTRRKLADRRYKQIRKSAKHTQLERLVVGDASDERSLALRVGSDFGRWVLTYPVKLPSTFFLDLFGVQSWKNMLRRTRTMFERESEFIPLLEYEDADRLNTYLIKYHPSQDPHHPPPDTVAFLDNLNYTGRKGAMWHFGKYLVDGMDAPASGERSTITIIGHSMGAIVACELLQRFHALPVNNLVFEAPACSVSNFKTNVIPFLEEQNLHTQIATLEGKDPANVVKTHVYDLCLHDDAENAEKNPGELDLSQRGSLLTWIDTLYQSPESENDRTFGRWVNAILATDDFPSDILDRVTIKEFGRDRLRERHLNVPVYTMEDNGTPELAEPTKHGEMPRYEPGVNKRKSNFKFWSKEYREREPKKPTPVPLSP
jgi:pimeloyl-ACP methyl ester carboxylesterase